MVDVTLVDSKIYVIQGIDGSAHKPALVWDADFILENTYHLAPYLPFSGLFGPLRVIFNLVKTHQFWSKTTPKDYLIEKAYHLVPFLGPLGVYLMPQWPTKGSTGVLIYQKVRCNVAVNSRYLQSDQNALVLVKNNHKRLCGWENLQFSALFGSFRGIINAWVTHKGFKRCSHIPKWSLECHRMWRSTHIIFNLVKNDHGKKIQKINKKFSKICLC